MGKIKILDESVSNIIAAGEVVENPASMIKEMIENSLDAKASVINIEVFNSGKEVKISDNGIGMSQDDVFLSIERHATSKISTKEDIFNLNTYGFRGEALASIAAVSKLTISSRTSEDDSGFLIKSYGGVVRKSDVITKSVGTEIEVLDLFYNTPARKKFMRKESTEYSKIKDIVVKEALANYNVAFNLQLDGKSVVKTSGTSIDNTILELFGKNVLRNLKKFDYGYLGNVEILRSSKDYIITYINGRYVKSNTIERAVIDGYYTKLMKGKYPFVIIFLEIDPQEIDVNVHPSKKIVKFSNDRIIYKKIKESIETFFYYTDRENWQPSIDLLKQNVYVDNNDENRTNIFVENNENHENKEKQIISLESDYIETVDNIKNTVYNKSNISKDDYEIAENHENKYDIYSAVDDTQNQNISKGTNDIEYFLNKMKNIENVSGDNNKNLNSSLYDVQKENVYYDDYKENKVNLDFASNNELLNDANDIKNIKDNDSVDEPKYMVGTFEKIEGNKIEYEVLGQIFNTYILVRNEQELEIYDQHIIHERILYEELKEKYYNKKLEIQHLLIPVKLDVLDADKYIIMDNLTIFEEFGFEVDDLDGDIILRAVPSFEFRESIQNVFLKLLNDVKREGDIRNLRENILISMSCKGAVKAGQKLDMEEMQNMVRRLHEVGEYTCPHGRPIIVKITRDYLDKMFGRKK